MARAIGIILKQEVIYRVRLLATGSLNSGLNPWSEQQPVAFPFLTPTLLRPPLI
jgi:hypothetical protein